MGGVVRSNGERRPRRGGDLAAIVVAAAALLLQEGSWGASHGLHEPDPDAEHDRELSEKAERGAELERLTRRPHGPHRPRRPWWQFLRRRRTPPTG